MYKFLLLFACFTLCYSYSNAQNDQATPVKIKRFHSPDKNSMVTDTSGNILPYENWHKLIQTGEYGLKNKQLGTDSLGYTIIKLSKEQIAERIANMPPPVQGPYFTNGDYLKPFEINDTNKFKFKAEDWAGKIVVLNFWFVKCSPCQQEIPELNKIVAAHANDKDVVFIGVCLDGKDDIEKSTKENPFSYHLVADGRAYTNDLGIKSYPVNVVIDKQGIVRYNSAGYGPGWAKWIAQAIDKYKKEPVAN
jgi:peroxiredoxin